MSGAGAIQQMIDSFRQNRDLLKRRGTGRYQNFDKSYITDYLVSGKKKRPTSFKKADPNYLLELRKNLIADRMKLKKRNMRILLMTIAIVTILSVVLFTY